MQWVTGFNVEYILSAARGLSIKTKDLSNLESWELLVFNYKQPHDSKIVY